MVTKEVARAWIDCVGKPPQERRVELNADGNIVDVETGEVVGELLLKRLLDEQKEKA